MSKNDSNQVYLEPIEHVYIHKKTGVKFTSVTKVLSTVEPHFDAEGVSLAIFQQQDHLKQERYIGMSQIQILDFWQMLNDTANIYGTKVHDIIEKYLLSNKWYFPEDPFEQKVIDGYLNLKIDEGMAMHPERIMFSQEYELAGMSDLIIDINDVFFDVGDWKGLAVNTPIFTKSGWKTMGTVNTNDVVYDMNGKETNVIHTSEIHNKPCYKINFDNNETVVADFDHRWLISFLRNKKFKDVVMTTEELSNYLTDLNSSGKKWSHKLPKVKISKPLFNNGINLPIDPYVLGVWLGDGNSVDNKITNMHTAIWVELKKRGYDIGDDVSGGGSGKASTRTLFGLLPKLRKLNLLKNKHLPDVYLRASYEQRLDLLRGFMDADGFYHKKRKRFVMSTTRDWQVESFVKLISSLGIKSSIFKFNKVFNGKIIPVTDICFGTDKINPFLCRNEKIIFCDRNHKNFKNIISVEKVSSEPTKCIEVDSDTHTFLYGHTFSITHNTNNIFNYYNPYGYETLHKPFDHLQSCQWSIYTIQLSVYALMYEMEFPTRKCRQIWVGYWAKETEVFSKIPIMYLKNEAMKLLQLHKFNTQYK